MTYDDDNEAQTIVRTAQDAAIGQELEPGNIYAFRVGDRVHQINLTGDQYRDAPRRKTGTAVVRDAASFLAYWQKHHDGDSEVYANHTNGNVTAVLDAHTPGAPRFGEHQVVLQLEHSEPWTAWTARTGDLMRQVQFAEFLEEHRQDVREPSAAEMLEIVQTFHATTKVTFKSGTVLKSGQRQLTYAEDQAASAGSRGQLTIPDTFTLGLQVYRGTPEADEVTARLRYRIDSDGHLFLGYRLDRPNEVRDSAFEAVVDALQGDLGVPILRGVPAVSKY